MTESECFYAITKYSYAYRKNHKVILWTYEKIQDHLTGLKEMIKFSLTHNFNKLHYLMVKNFLDTINYKMNLNIKIYFIKDVIDILKCIDWNIIKIENSKNKVKISLVKLLCRYVF